MWASLQHSIVVIQNPNLDRECRLSISGLRVAHLAPRAFTWGRDCGTIREVVKEGGTVQIEANGIAIELERDGDPGAPAVLLICGLGAQLLYWAPTFVQGLLAGGFQVVRFDNRDTGLSQKFPGSDEEAPYTIADMAADATGVLDALGIVKAQCRRPFDGRHHRPAAGRRIPRPGALAHHYHVDQPRARPAESRPEGASVAAGRARGLG